MASRSNTLQVSIQGVLVVLILGLAYYLYYSITEPYDRIERQEALTEQTRTRMIHVRTALIDYERDKDTFPDSLGMLLTHVRADLKEDSVLSAGGDSTFARSVNLDSLLYSPRSGKRFIYKVSDTGQVETYLLEDPDTEDQIGTLKGDPTELNAASWE